MSSSHRIRPSRELSFSRGSGGGRSTGAHVFLGVRSPSPHVGEHDLGQHAIARSSPIPPSNTLPTAHPVGPLLAQDVSRPSSDGRFPVVRRSMDSCRVIGGPTRPSRPLFPPYFLAFATFSAKPSALGRRSSSWASGRAHSRSPTARNCCNALITRVLNTRVSMRVNAFVPTFL